MQPQLMEGRVAVIAGVGEGLGRDVARELAGAGADLVLLARRMDVIAPLATEIEQLGRRCWPALCDITSVEQCEAVANQAVSRFGRIDSLVNVAYLSDKWVPVLETARDMAGWHSIFDVNVFGAMAMLRAAARSMAARGSGTIVMINSMAAERLTNGRAGYQGSKAALAAMTKTAALELAPRNVRVNSLHPGWMAGDAIDQVFAMWAEQRGTDVETERARIESCIPLGYIPPTTEYARIVLFLASDMSAPITGQSIHANGGQWLS